jgi:hypothetical protein
VAKVVGPPGQGRGLLRRAENRHACFDPRAPVGDRGHFAAPDAAEETAVRGGAEPFNVLAEKPGQLGMGWHYATVALWAVLELPLLALTAVIGPLAADIGCRMSQVQIARHM